MCRIKWKAPAHEYRLDRVSNRAGPWSRWKRLAHRAAQFQAHVLFSVLCVVVVVPIGAARSLWTDPLGPKAGAPSGLRWARPTRI